MDPPKYPDEAATVFLEAFYDAINQTNSRDLDRDLSLKGAHEERSQIRERVDKNQAGIQLIDAKVGGIDSKLDAAINDKTLPGPILNAIAEPNLKELSELMKAGQIQKALAYAERHIKSIDKALNEDSGPDNRYAEALRVHRQRLLFTASTAVSWQGNIDAGSTFWWRARDLGPIDPEWYDQAATAVFNSGLEKEFRYLVGKMQPESEVFKRYAPLVAHLDEDWNTVDRLLSDTCAPDLLLLRVQAQIQIINPKEVKAVTKSSDLLDVTDSDTTLPVLNLKRVRLTLDLLKLVVFEYTPLDYNRGSLIDRLINRLNVALNTTEPDSLYRAKVLGYFDMAAALLRDDKLKKQFDRGVAELPDNIRSTVFFSDDPSLSVEKIDALLAKDSITLIQATALKAELYQASGQLQQIEDELYRVLFATSDNRERLIVLRILIEHFRQTNQTEQIQRLIDSTAIRPADRWVLRAENLPPDKTPLDLVDEVKAFPLDLDVIEHLAKFTLSTTNFTSPENAPPDEADLKRAEEAVRWTTRLTEVLPTRSSLRCHAQALFGARRYEELLVISRELDPVYSEQAAEFEAAALIGLGRRTEAIDCFISASKSFPESIRFVVHAARFLLIENRPKEAANLLDLHIAAGSQDPDILHLYAHSIHDQAPNSEEHASRSFDLFARVYELQPAPEIALSAWNAARAAGREQEANRFFTAVAKDAIRVTANSVDDIIEAVSTSDGRVIQFNRSLKALAELAS